jgi:hypothetical protein
MKILVLLVGIVLSLWVGFTVYGPTQIFVTDIKEIYLASKVTQRTISQKSAATINAITDSYKEVARVFWVKVAEKNIKDEITTPTPWGAKDPIEKLFQHNIALWVAFGAGFTTLSVYFNIIWLIAFFLKPVTFFMK